MTSIPCKDCLVFPICKQKFKKRLAEAAGTQTDMVVSTLLICNQCTKLRSWLGFTTHEIITHFNLQNKSSSEKQQPKVKQFLEVYE